MAASALRTAWNSLTAGQRSSAVTFIQNAIADVLASGSTLDSLVARTPNDAVSLEVELADRVLQVRLRLRT